MFTTAVLSAIAAKVTNYISFPNLGIDEIKINEVAFSIPGTNIKIAWYGLIIMLGIITAFCYVLFMGKKRSGLITDDLLDIAIFTVLPGIIGARVYYVFFDRLQNPSSYKSFYDIVAVWEGGLAIYGGIIFGAIGCLLALRHKKIRIPLFFDYLAPAVMIAQSIGRWGNFCNGEAYGSVTNSPFAMTIREVITTVGESGATTSYDHILASSVHPTFLYESAWNLIGFALLTFLVFRKKYDGQVVLGYFAWYGAGRMVIEGLRQDSLYIGNSGIRVSQLLAFCTFIVATFLFVFFMIKIKGKKLESSIYKCAPAGAVENEQPDTEADKQIDENGENNENNGENN